MINSRKLYYINKEETPNKIKKADVIFHRCDITPVFVSELLQNITVSLQLQKDY